MSLWKLPFKKKWSGDVILGVLLQMYMCKYYVSLPNVIVQVPLCHIHNVCEAKMSEKYLFMMPSKRMELTV